MRTVTISKVKMDRSPTGVTIVFVEGIEFNPRRSEPQQLGL
jgi:hypothetical protein